MSDENTNTRATGSIEEDLAHAIISILQTTNSPAIQRAREVIAHRLAISGDVAPSRIPAPRNITEIGGYINLLSDYGETEQRSRMIAAALGIAGPQLNLPQPGQAPPLFFASRPQARPEGPQQATFPLSFNMRSDFLPAFDMLRENLASLGVAMPVLAPVRVLPPAGSNQAMNGAAQLDLIGRRLTLSPTAALRDPMLDPLSLSRPSGGGAYEVVARVVDPAAPAAVATPDAAWTSWACDAGQCSEIESLDARVQLTPLLNGAGWHQSALPSDPENLFSTGSWSQWLNITGLVPGTTRLGDELSLVYRTDQIIASSVRDHLDLVWDGEAFSVV